MNNLYEALEVCLQDIEQGSDIETVLFRYPDLADELRPILEASVNAKAMLVPAPSPEVVRRNRAKVLQHAAQLRETNAKSSSRRMWFAPLRRVAVSLVVIVALFMSGTGLVSAASDTLPGDNLYPVKRTWEDVLILFTFNMQQREALEIKQEKERLYELQALFAEGRSAEVDFSGTVTSQNGNEWVVAGFTLVISPQTELRDGPIVVGSAVRVRGWTQSNGVVLAERVRLLSSDAKLPDHEGEGKNDGESNQQDDDNSGRGSGDETPEIEETDSPESESSNSGSGSDNSGPGSGENSNDSGDNNNDNSGSNNDNSGSDDSDDNSGGGSNSGSGGGGEDNSGSGSGGEDNSGSGGGGEDNSGSGGAGEDNSGSGRGDD